MRAVSEVVGTPLAYDTLDDLRDRLEQISPHLVAYGVLQPVNFDVIAEKFTKSTEGRFDSSLGISQKTLKDFFMTDPITRASPTMAKCVVAVSQSISGK